MKNPFGYLIAVTLEYVQITYGFLFMGCMLSMGFGAFYFAISIAADLDANLIAINENAKMKDCHARIFQQWCEFIRLHADMKEYTVPLSYSHPLKFTRIPKLFVSFSDCTAVLQKYMKQH